MGRERGWGAGQEKDLKKQDEDVLGWDTNFGSKYGAYQGKSWRLTYENLGRFFLLQ